MQAAALAGAVADADALKSGVGHHHAIAADKPEKPGVELVGAGTVVGVHEADFGGVFAFDGDEVAPLEAEEVLLETGAAFEADALFAGFDGRPACFPHAGDHLGGGEEGVAGGDTLRGLSGKDGGGGAEQVGIGELVAVLKERGAVGGKHGVGLSVCRTVSGGTSARVGRGRRYLVGAASSND